MIHDIFPHKLDNTYEEAEIQEQSMVLYFWDKSVLLACENGKWRLPYYSEITEKKIDSKVQVLFSLDGEKIFLYENNGEKKEFGESFLYVPLRNFREEKRISKEQRFAIMTGWHLYKWYEETEFCGACGRKLVHHKTMRMKYCEFCKKQYFPKIAPAVIIGVVDKDRILLSKYAGREYKGYALLAGFVEIGETPEDTVRREVMEEVGLSVKNIRYYKSQPGGIDGNLLLGFYCELDGTNQIKRDEEELAMAQWYSREQIPVEDNGYSLTFEMIARFKSSPELFSNLGEEIV